MLRNLRPILCSLRVYSTMTAKRLDGKVAVVTASTDGIGYAIAQGLAENGAKVVISSRKQVNVDKAVKSLQDLNLDVTGTVCHVGKEEDRKLLFQKAIDVYGQVDILISNAGISPVYAPILQTPEKAWDKIFDINLKSGYLLAQAAAPHIQKSKGSMLFVSSITGYTPFSMIGAYSVSKTALIGLVKALSQECAPMGVRVNGIAPGTIKTEFASMLTETDEVNKMILANTPLNRFGTPQECAGAAVFLSSDEASYITGEIIAMTGGMQSRL